MYALRSRKGDGYMLKVPDPNLAQWMDDVRAGGRLPSDDEQAEAAYKFPNWHEEILDFLVLEMGFKATNIVVALKGGHVTFVRNLMRKKMGRPVVQVLEGAAA